MRATIFSAAALVGAAALPVTPAQVAGDTTGLATRPIPQRNLLGNGGFESWSQGVSPGPFGGPLAPDLWDPMGDAAGTFDQTALLIERIPADGLAGPPWVAELTAIEPASFVSQTLENGGEFRGLWVTFSVDIATTSAAVPAIEIDDGFGTSSFSELVLSGEVDRRFTVRHMVAGNATQVVFRIYPDQVIEVDDAMAVVGAQPDAVYVPRRNPEPGLMELPLGAVIDWYRFDPSIPVPEGFAIADGSTVADPASPFFGRATIDLSQRFVRGVTSALEIGEVGGAATLNLNHNHDMDHYHSGTTNSSSADWFILLNPIGPVLEASQNTHKHSFTTGGPLGEPSGGDLTGGALGSVSLEPPFVGLLKIMRIK